MSKEKLKGENHTSHFAPHTSNKGITLIALIITIIVMMILVAVTVTFTVGENGILSQAKESAKLSEREQLREQIMGQIKLTNKGKIKIQETYDAAKELLEAQDYTVEDLQLSDGTFEVIGKKGTYKYKITETEIIILEEASGGTEIAKITGPLGEAINTENYGKKVIGYKSKGEGLDTLVWRVLYQDANNYYLISETENGEQPISSLPFYEDSDTKTEKVEKYNNGADVSNQGQDLMPLASSLFTEENTNPNIIATAYMCDTEVWDDYTDSEGKAAWAMGGPTIELFINACNALLESQFSCSVSNSYGYQETNDLSFRFSTDISYLNNSYWLASPEGDSDNRLTSHNGELYFNLSCEVYAGKSACPIVCVPVDNFDYQLGESPELIVQHERIEVTDATIPTGFEYVEGTESTGYVIENETEGSQFVWVPVSDINLMVMCKTCGSWVNNLDTETAECKICRENTILVGKLYSNSVLRRTILSYNDPESDDYTAMAKSVAKYKGFYVGRYETSKSSSGIAQSKKSTEADVIVSANANSDGNWNGLKALCETYSTSSVQGKMIWGSQYDQMVAWIGNSSGLSSGYNTSSNPGTVDTDVINNIYDLYGNKYEATQELSGGTGNPVNRSGDNASGKNGLAYRCTNWAATNTSTDLGARIILYITE